MSRYNIVSTVFLVTLLVSLALDGLFHIPLWWYVIVLVGFVAMVIYGSLVVSASFFMAIKCSGRQDSIALTFDDGPIENNTEKILEILRSYNIPATFFCIGNRVDKNPGILKRIEADGHLIGNHTYWHGSLFDLKSSPMVVKELVDTDVAVFNAIGKRPRFFRPPYGVTNPMIAKAVRRGNYTVVGWSVRSFDTITSDPEKLFLRITKKVKGGDIILLHDYCDSTITVLPRLIEFIKKAGLKVVRADELLKEKGYA